MASPISVNVKTSPSQLWSGRNVKGINSLLLMNTDLANTVMVGSDLNSLVVPILPNGSLSVDPAENWYVVGAVAGTSPLVVLPNGQSTFLGLTAGLGSLQIPSIRSPNFNAGISGWTINKDGSAEFNNLVIRGQFFGTFFFIDSTGAFFYDPVTGFLVASIANANGTNRLGDAYLKGFVTYSSGILAFQFLAGIIRVYGAPGPAGPWTAGNAVFQISGTAITLTATTLNLAGQVTATSGTPLTPTLITTDAWNPITLDAGWTSVVTPEYRLLPDGNVQVRGQATHAGTVAAVNINGSNPIPALYWPGANRIYRPPVQADSAGTIQISTTGVFAMRASGFSAVTAFMDGIYSI